MSIIRRESSIHWVLVPKPVNGHVSVKWLVTPDGKCHGKEYYDANPGCRASLLAQAMQLAIKGRVGKVPENGHPLQAPYDGLHVLKPGHHRFLWFRFGDVCYITNGAPKKTKNKQNPDYQLAMDLMLDFYERNRRR